MLNSSTGRWIFYVGTFLTAFGFGLAVAQLWAVKGGEVYQRIPRPPIQPSVSITTTTIDAALTDIALRNDSTLFGAGSSAGLQRSDDFGHTWSKVNIDTGGWLIRTVDFVDDQTGWAAGNPILMKTEDGGETWTRHYLPGWLHDVEMDFIDQSVGYIAATDCSRARGRLCVGNEGNKVLKTVDGGVTWRTVYRDDSSLTVFQIKAIDRQTVFVLSGASVVRRTIDGGATWEVTYINRNAAEKMAVSPDGAVWLAGEHTLLRSVDKGLTWQIPLQLSPGFSSEKWHAIGFSSTGLGVVAGDDSCVGITLDSGQSWSKYCSDKIEFGLMFDVEIHENTAVISSSSDTAHDSISRLRLTHPGLL